jgi:hypothetical protein
MTDLRSSSLRFNSVAIVFFSSLRSVVLCDPRGYDDGDSGGDENVLRVFATVRLTPNIVAHLTEVQRIKPDSM